MAGMQEEQDARLLQLLRDDGVPVPDLLHWLHAHHGPGPPSQTRESLSEISMNHEQWREQLAVTNPQSFAVTFLNYVRAEVQPLIAAADTTGDLVVKSSNQSYESDQTQLPEKKPEVIVAPEPSKVGAESFSDPNGNKGTSGTNSFAVTFPTKQKERRKSGGTIQHAPAAKPVGVPVYDDDFPALGKAPTVTVQKASAQLKQKRRVTPTPMVNPVVDSAFILAKVEAPVIAPQGHNNKAKVSGKGLLKVDMDILMQRCEKNRKQKQKEKPEVPKKETSKPWVLEKPESGSASTSSNQGLSVHLAPADPLAEVKGVGSRDDVSTERSASPTSTAVVSTSATAHSVSAEPGNMTSTDKERICAGSGSSTLGTFPPHPPSKTLTSMAAVHATLMVVKLVPSLLEELHFLLQLLSLEPAFAGVGPCNASRALDTVAEVKQEKVPLFRSGDDCAGYACYVLEQAGRILDCVGEQILVALIEEPAIARHSSTLSARLKASLADQQAAALRSFKAYEAASRTNGAFEQSSTGGAVRLKSLTMPGLPMSLPFHAARDSRNIFKTQEEQRAYNNREQCRDQFYAIMREAASAYSAFGWISSGSEGEGYTKMKDAVRHFLQVLLVENYPWFAELFLEQVLQVSNCGETDPEVTSLARQDPAKLQRLHDRLTSTTTVRLTAATHKQGGNGLGSGESRLTLSPSSPWSQVKSMEQRLPSKETGSISDGSASSVQILNKGRGTVGNWKERSSLQNDTGSRFAGYFPQALCVYVWFLEAADSHRLNTQMIWSIKGKITVLTQLPPYSRDAADIGSGFTQRVLALKALAGLLGYLFVSPGAGARPPAPGPGAHDCLTRTVWDVSRSEPPVNVPAILAKAQMQGSILLNLPWVLEFLRLLKADWQALSHPHFQAIVSSLRDVYLLPMLDPSSKQFGVGSICILASLDGFFEYMALSPSDWPKKVGSNVSSPELKGNRGIEGEDSTRRRQTEMQAGDEHLGFEILDTMLGIVDTRYIQHCCPLLMELRGVLVEGKKRRQKQRDPNWPDSPGLPRGRSVRKITPVQRPGPSQSLDMSGSVMIGEKVSSMNVSDQQEDQLKLKLQRTFLEQRPHLRRVVDFVVDTVAGNSARAAVLKLVPPALQTALEKLQMVLRGNAGELSGTANSRDVPWNTSRGGQVETAIEHIITTTIHQLLSPALDYAKAHAADRTAEALAALADPEESSFVLGVASGIAAETAGLAACRKAMASISGEIRKRITDDVEVWRRKSQAQLLDRESRTSSSQDGLRIQTLQAHGGIPATAGHQARSQSWPKAAELQLALEDPIISSAGESLQQAFDSSDRLISEPTPVPETEHGVTRGDWSEASPPHVMANSGVHMSAVPTSSSVKIVKTSSAVKRQLSFSFKESTTTGVDTSTSPLLAKDQTATIQELVNGNPEKVPIVKEIKQPEIILKERACSPVSQQDPSGLQTLADRVIQACSNACYYCSFEPFADENRHFLRHHLAVVCVSLEGLLSRIQGATPAGGFDALVFHNDPRLQHVRDHISNTVVPNVQLRVELGLVRRTVALALHLFLWNPPIMLGSCHECETLLAGGAGTKSSPLGSLRELAIRLPDILNGGVSSSAWSFRNDKRALVSTDSKSTNFQGGESTGRHTNGDGGELLHALVVTWRRLVECQILPTAFLVGELLTPWRWKLAMSARPWQGAFEHWSAVVQKGVASVLIGMLESGKEAACSQELETLLCSFLRIMAGRGQNLKSGESAVSSCAGGAAATCTVPVNWGPHPDGYLLRIERQDRSGCETGSLAVGIAVHVLQHFPATSQVDNVEKGDLIVPSSENLEGRYIGLRKLVEDLCQDYG